MNIDLQELTPLTQKNSQYSPTQQQLLDYAQYIGFTLPQDQHLLYIAHQGLKAELPSNWLAYGNKKGDLLYKDTITGTFQEQHPADQLIKEKFLREKKRLQLLAAQKEVIMEMNESELMGSQVYRGMKTSNSLKESNRKSYLKTEERRIEENVYSERSMESVQSMNEEEEIPVSTNFYGSQSRTLQPEIMEFSQMTGKLGKKYSNKLRQEIQSITIGVIKQREVEYEEHKKEKERREVEELGREVKEKQEVLRRLVEERMRKERQIVRVQQEFEVKKQEILEEYRRKMRVKLEREKRRKEKEMEETYQSTLKKQLKSKEVEMNMGDGFKKKGKTSY